MKMQRQLPSESEQVLQAVDRDRDSVFFDQTTFARADKTTLPSTRAALESLDATAQSEAGVRLATVVTTTH